MKKFWLSILVAFVSVAITFPAQSRVNYGKFEVVTDTTSNRLILEGDTITSKDSSTSVQLIHKDGEWVIPAINWSESDTSGLSTDLETNPFVADRIKIDASSLNESDSALFLNTFEGQELKILEASGDLYSQNLWLDSSGGNIRNLSELHLENGGTVGSSSTYNNAFVVGPLEVGGTVYLGDNTITGRGWKPVSVSTTHTQWGSGLNDEEIWKSVNNYSDTFVITRLELRSKGDTTAADTASVRVVNESDSTVLISQEVDGSTTPSSLTSNGDTYTLEITNQTGNNLIGSVNLQGRYE